MRNITFQLRCDLEERLRKYTGRKGELSKVLNEAVEEWLNKKEANQLLNHIKSTEENRK